MQFNSYGFILFFLPISTFIYFMAAKIKPTLSKLVLIISSIAFFAIGRPEMLAFLAGSVTINYSAAVLIRKAGTKNKLHLTIPVIINAALLLYFKYLDFALHNINALFGTDIGLRNLILPLGISFYTFQQIAYIVAVWNGELKDVDITDYLTYILYYPKLVMGPLADPVDFIAQINQDSRKKVNLANITSGIKIFSYGLFKKAMLADTFSKAVTWTHGHIHAATSMDCVLLIIFYTFEIYFDFSGYCDMATGISSMINIDLPMNFVSPYKAVSIRDFWKRWHITLTGFLTKYIYIPLGGSRKGIATTYLNTIIVFLVSGLWHGANWTFILWGLLHGLLSCFDRLAAKAQERIPRFIRWFFTLAVVSVLWLLFSSDSVKQWLEVLKKIMSMQSGISVSDNLIDSFNLSENPLIYSIPGIDFLRHRIKGFNMLVFTFVSCIICFIPENNYRKRDRLTIVDLILSSLAFIWGIICLGSESTFLYFGF